LWSSLVDNKHLFLLSI